MIKAVKAHLERGVSKEICRIKFRVSKSGLNHALAKRQKVIQLRNEKAKAALKRCVSARCALARSKKHRTRAAETTSKRSLQPLVVGDFCFPRESVGTSHRHRPALQESLDR